MTKKQRIPQAHLDLISRIAKRVMTKCRLCAMPFEDLYSYGLIGYFEARERFDPTKGTGTPEDFERFAKRRIRGAMFDALRNEDILSRLDRRTKRKIVRAEEKLAQEFGRKPTDKEIADKLWLDIDVVNRLRQRIRLVSIDHSSHAYELLVGWQKIDDGSAKKLAGIIIAKAGLSRREKIVLELHCLGGMTQTETGRVLNVDTSRVCQIRQGLMVKLRRAKDTLELKALERPAEPHRPRIAKMVNLPKPTSEPERKPIDYRAPISCEVLLKTVCEYYGVTNQELLWEARKDSYLTLARKVLAYLMRNHTGYDRSAIGKYIGERSIFWVNKACEFIQSDIKTNTALRDDIHEIHCMLEEKLGAP